MPSLSGKKAPLFLILALAACGDPELGTSLNSAGPPELVEIHVTRDNGALVGPAGIVGGPSPAAIFCTNDADLKVSDSFCADRTATLATGVSAVAPRFRIIFDELLDPAIETLEDPGTGDPNEATLRDTQPVTVTCGGTAVTYDGFYDPSGNALTGPPGPALVINVADILGTDTECTIELNDGAIKDKDGNAVPAAQNGPYTFTTSALRAVATQPDLYDPELGPVEFDPTAEG
ncbi:MAG TPA: hypothetical protein VFG83_10115, partial [Kofleriaceae bacterium]|nr:hypothetical protein [Kofleriaceae bacterium]